MACCELADKGRTGVEVPLYMSYRSIFRILSGVLHVVGIIHFFFAAFYDVFATKVPVEVNPVYQAWAGQFKFLTYWNVCLQAVYMSYAFGIDVFTLFNKNKKDETTQKLVRFKDTVEASVALPIAMFVSFTFWGLMAVDRELVLPSKVDPYFPEWLNHMEHTNIIIFQLLELVTSPRVYPSNKVGLITLGVFQSSYLIWMHVVYYKSGIWVYPIFKQLTPPFRVLFLAGSVSTCFVFYFIGSFVNWFLWINKKMKKK
uniref:Androgen-induced gene 1 protein n=2 Tax=Lygus hesperus TaxID=30085 RepID=A0A0K8TF02_LYGHE